MDYTAVKKVHVVFKTHLDIGFTDLARNVLDQYVNRHIPHAIRLAEEMNTEHEKRFIWTLGSYLIDYYLKRGDSAARERMERAVKRGDICWHGLACTTHSELLDEDLFAYDLSISDQLDAHFGKTTISAKMTDVPGHTRAIVAPLANHGKKYLHIGVNASSMVPDVPGTFLWRSGGQEIVVQYSADYGAPCYVEGMDEVLEFAHTGDNLGPQSVEAVEAEMARIQAIYPNAVVEASTMDRYAEKLMEYRDQLPVIEEEIGDTWIHGIASDPLKTAKYRQLIAFKNRLKREGIILEEQPWYDNFMMNLLLVAEHTWGLDYKKYLADFTNWEKKDFQAAREADTTTLDFLTNRNASMLSMLKGDFEKYRGGHFEGSYRFFESSHIEQREYITKAVDALPQPLKTEAQKELEKLQTGMETGSGSGADQGSDTAAGRTVSPYEHVSVGFWTVSFDGSGTMVYLEKEGRRWITDGCFGRLSYETYNAGNCVGNYYAYNRGFRENQCWSEADFSKPGLEFAEDLKNRNYVFGAEKICLEGNTITIRLAGNDEAKNRYGCPAHAAVVYEFGDTIHVRLSWTEKDASRIPEALWFDVNFDVENPYRFLLKKMGTLVSPFDVVRAGNRRQHCVESLEYSGADGRLTVENIHSPLVSVGGRFLYGDYRPLPDIAKGFSFNLFNNKWGTNFKMWCEDDCCFEYVITVQ